MTERYPTRLQAGAILSMLVALLDMHRTTPMPVRREMAKPSAIGQLANGRRKASFREGATDPVGPILQGQSAQSRQAIPKPLLPDKISALVTYPSRTVHQPRHSALQRPTPGQSLRIRLQVGIVMAPTHRVCAHLNKKPHHRTFMPTALEISSVVPLTARPPEG